MSARIEAIGAARAEALAEQLAARIDVELPGVRAERRGSDVALHGRGLARRAATDPALRWIAGWLR